MRLLDDVIKLIYTTTRVRGIWSRRYCECATRNRAPRLRCTRVYAFVRVTFFFFYTHDRERERRRGGEEHISHIRARLFWDARLSSYQDCVTPLYVDALRNQGKCTRPRVWKYTPSGSWRMATRRATRGKTNEPGEERCRKMRRRMRREIAFEAIKIFRASATKRDLSGSRDDDTSDANCIAGIYRWRNLLHAVI